MPPLLEADLCLCSYPSRFLSNCLPLPELFSELIWLFISLIDWSYSLMPEPETPFSDPSFDELLFDINAAPIIPEEGAPIESLFKDPSIFDL